MGDALQQVPLRMSAVALFLDGDDRSCALLADGSLTCWGLNNYGQLGLGDRESRGDDEGEMGEGLPSTALD